MDNTGANDLYMDDILNTLRGLDFEHLLNSKCEENR